MAEAAPALGFSLTCNLDGNRQLVFQSFVAADAPMSEVNAAVDKVMAITDRQRAKYEIQEFLKEQDNLSRDIATGEEGVAQVEANFRKAQAGLDVQLLEINKLQTEIKETASAKAAARGSSVNAVLKGQMQNNLDRYEKGIEQIREEKARQSAERAAALDEFNATQERRKARVAELGALIAAKQALIDG